ncbi:MAG: hypothetical protein AAGA05_07635 [Pseudomonadota bacterium]
MSTLAQAPRHTQLFALLHQQNMADIAVARAKSPKPVAAKAKCAIEPAQAADEHSEEAVLAALCSAAVRSFDRPSPDMADPLQA